MMSFEDYYGFHLFLFTNVEEIHKFKKILFTHVEITKAQRNVKLFPSVKVFSEVRELLHIFIK